MKYSVALFDFDGTIADSFPFFSNAFNTIAEKYHLRSLTLEEMDMLRDKGAREVIQASQVPWWKIPFIGRDFKRMFREHSSEIPIFNGMKEVLEELHTKGIVIGVLTSNSKGNVEDFLQRNEIMCVEFVQGDVGVFGKSKSIQRVLRSRGFQKEQVVYVGDEVRDIDACRKVGIDIISATWGYNSEKRLRESNPEVLVLKPDHILSAMI